MKRLTLGYTTCIDLGGIPPYDFGKTIRKYTLYGTDWFWLTPFEVHLKSMIWTATRLLNETPIGLRLKPLGNVENPSISMTVFSEDTLSNENEKEIVETISWSLGLRSDISEFYDLAENFNALRQAKEDLCGMRIAANPRLFDLVLLAHTLQAASYGRTERMIRLVYGNYGGLLEFDGKKVFVSPSPKEIAETSKNELMSRCKLGYRAANIVFNANVIASGSVPSFADLKRMTFEEARNSVRKMKGIGEYSAEIVLFAIHPCFPVDSWSVSFFARLFGIDPADETSKLIQTLREFAEREFAKWQSYAYDYIINDLEQLSRKFAIAL
jgi:3-methyladenine DNA glycosylase/8-oxoguanine DNA glycosylase